MHPKQRKLKGRQHPTFIREHAYVLLAAAFSLVNALFLSHFLGYFSTFLVYLPLVVFCVPARTAFDALLWKDWNNGYYRKTAFAIWTVYLLLFGIHLRTPTVPATKPGATYFIAANLYNSEAVLPSWTREMHHLITYLGESNVFVSIYESNSIDNTPALLKVFREELDARSVLNKIVLDKRERGHWGLNSPARIAFMAEIRNKVLDPLKETERAYSKVIFFNDVFFDWRDVSLLINTKEGDYDLACAMDFDGIGLYDIWVTRDACGRPTKEIWPYFSTDSRAVRSLKRNEPIEVASCWNGIAVFDASWFLPSDFNVTKPSSAHPTQTGDFVPPLPLQFRGSTDCVSSECFIVSMDLHFWNSPQRPKIYINPRVKVAYEKLNYIFHVQLEQLGLAWPWRLVWQDWIGWKLFGWVSDAIWLKEDKCQRNWEGFIKPNWC